MDDSDDSLYHPDESDDAFKASQRKPQPSRPQTPEPNNDTKSVASDPPSALRRSTRRPVPVTRLDPSVDKRPVSLALQVPREASTHKPGTRNHTIHLLLKLPGFSFTSDTNVFSASRSTRFAYLLGAQSAPAFNERVVIPSNQSIVSVRVADVLEVCCDEWLEYWQDEPLTSGFWGEAAESLRCQKRYWASRKPNASGDEVYTICFAYTRHWDENGRGRAISDEASWGFELENAARDFLECIRESEARFGLIERARSVDRNRSANRNGTTRALVANDAPSRGSRSRTAGMDNGHQFVLGGHSDVVVVTGPRHGHSDQGQGSSSNRVRARVERGDPNRLLVTFSGLVNQMPGEREALHGDEGKDVRPQAGADEDVEMS
ncbi:hypothetical protein KVR01_004891 [Diaporthe batatas]|uniref:uncharacterized protein n=1 Tax=Diaporthe batatas TaxID=748121 RepID=UPI001D053857|nr:uncharacterized protein KVR01_004891 [Diaporthe batatas]KAG8164616.1 hypothetical protein KVR01_004891 [Diaporthe batatas]